MRSVWGCFLLGLLFAMLGMAFNALTPQIIRVTVDSILGAEDARLPAWLLGALGFADLRAEPGRALWLAAAAVTVSAALRAVCGYGQRVSLAKGSEGFVKGIRDALFEHIQSLPFEWHTAHQTGEMIQRCTSDVEVIRNFVCNQLVEVARTLFLMALYLSIMFSMNVRLSLIVLCFVPITGLSSWVFFRRIASRFKAADEAEGELTTMVQENLTGVRVVRAFGREIYEIGKFNEKNDGFSQLWIRLGRVLSLFWASGTLLTSSQVFVTIIAGVVEAVNGGLTLASSSCSSATPPPSPGPSGAWGACWRR